MKKICFKAVALVLVASLLVDPLFAAGLGRPLPAMPTRVADLFTTSALVERLVQADFPRWPTAVRFIQIAAAASFLSLTPQAKALDLREHHTPPNKTSEFRATKGEGWLAYLSAVGLVAMAALAGSSRRTDPPLDEGFPPIAAAYYLAGVGITGFDFTPNPRAAEWELTPFIIGEPQLESLRASFLSNAIKLGDTLEIVRHQGVPIAIITPYLPKSTEVQDPGHYLAFLGVGDTPIPPALLTRFKPLVPARIMHPVYIPTLGRSVMYFAGSYHPRPRSGLTFSSEVLLEGFPDVRGKRVGDAGSGTGVQILTAMRKGASSGVAVEALNISIWNTLWNVRQLGYRGLVDVVHSDSIGRAMSGREPCDLWVANLPTNEPNHVVLQHYPDLTESHMIRIADSTNSLLKSLLEEAPRTRAGAVPPLFIAASRRFKDSLVQLASVTGRVVRQSPSAQNVDNYSLYVLKPKDHVDTPPVGPVLPIETAHPGPEWPEDNAIAPPEPTRYPIDTGVLVTSSQAHRFIERAAKRFFLLVPFLLESAKAGTFAYIHRVGTIASDYAFEASSFLEDDDAPRPRSKTIEHSHDFFQRAWDRGLRRFIPEPTGIWHLEHEQNVVPVRASDFLHGYLETNFGKRALRLWDSDKHLLTPIAAHALPNVLADIASVLAYYYEPEMDGGTTLTDFLLNNGDIVAHQNPDGSFDLKLITARASQSNVPPPAFIRSLIELPAYDEPLDDATKFYSYSANYPHSVFVRLPMPISNPSVAFEGLVRGLSRRYADLKVIDAEGQARRQAETWIRDFRDSPEGAPYRDAADRFLAGSLPLDFGSGEGEGIVRTDLLEEYETGLRQVLAANNRSELDQKIFRNSLKYVQAELATRVRTPVAQATGTSATWAAEQWLLLRWAHATPDEVQALAVKMAWGWETVALVMPIVLIKGVLGLFGVDIGPLMSFILVLISVGSFLRTHWRGYFHYEGFATRKLRYDNYKSAADRWYALRPLTGKWIKMYGPVYLLTLLLPMTASWVWVLPLALIAVGYGAWRHRVYNRRGVESGDALLTGRLSRRGFYWSAGAASYSALRAQSAGRPRKKKYRWPAVPPWKIEPVQIERQIPERVLALKEKLFREAGGNTLVAVESFLRSVSPDFTPIEFQDYYQAAVLLIADAAKSAGGRQPQIAKRLQEMVADTTPNPLWNKTAVLNYAYEALWGDDYKRFQSAFSYVPIDPRDAKQLPLAVFQSRNAAFMDAANAVADFERAGYQFSLTSYSRIVAWKIEKRHDAALQMAQEVLAALGSGRIQTVEALESLFALQHQALLPTREQLQTPEGKEFVKALDQFLYTPAQLDAIVALLPFHSHPGVKRILANPERYRSGLFDPIGTSVMLLAGLMVDPVYGPMMTYLEDTYSYVPQTPAEMTVIRSFTSLDQMKARLERMTDVFSTMPPMSDSVLRAALVLGTTEEASLNVLRRLFAGGHRFQSGNEVFSWISFSNSAMSQVALRGIRPELFWAVVDRLKTLGWKPGAEDPHLLWQWITAPQALGAAYQLQAAHGYSVHSLNNLSSLRVLIGNTLKEVLALPKSSRFSAYIQAPGELLASLQSAGAWETFIELNRRGMLTGELLTRPEAQGSPSALNLIYSGVLQIRLAVMAPHQWSTLERLQKISQVPVMYLIMKQLNPFQRRWLDPSVVEKLEVLHRETGYRVSELDDLSLVLRLAEDRIQIERAKEIRRVTGDPLQASTLRWVRDDHLYYLALDPKVISLRKQLVSKGYTVHSVDTEFIYHLAHKRGWAEKVGHYETVSPDLAELKFDYLREQLERPAFREALRQDALSDFANPYSENAGVFAFESNGDLRVISFPSRGQLQKKLTYNTEHASRFVEEGWLMRYAGRFFARYHDHAIANLGLVRRASIPDLQTARAIRQQIGFNVLVAATPPPEGLLSVQGFTADSNQVQLGEFRWRERRGLGSVMRSLWRFLKGEQANPTSKSSRRELLEQVRRLRLAIALGQTGLSVIGGFWLAMTSWANAGAVSMPGGSTRATHAAA